ncbi:MAG: hypothetical protein IPG48_08175 [Saprospiraceae bacterium]|nr:hypothetical protein [Saprospiraceae bacterium]
MLSISSSHDGRSYIHALVFLLRSNPYLFFTFIQWLSHLSVNKKGMVLPSNAWSDRITLFADMCST